MTRSPGEKQLVTDASIAPVPEEARIRTSCAVPSTVFRSARTDEYNVAEILGAVVNVSAHHGLQRLGIKRCGPRRQEALLLDVHGLKSRIAKGIGDLGYINKDGGVMARGQPAAGNVTRGSTADCRRLSGSAGLLRLLALAGVSGRAGGSGAPQDPALLVAHRHARLELVHAVGHVIPGGRAAGWDLCAILCRSRSSASIFRRR